MMEQFNGQIVPSAYRLGAGSASLTLTRRPKRHFLELAIRFQSSNHNFG